MKFKVGDTVKIIKMPLDYEKFIGSIGVLARSEKFVFDFRVSLKKHINGHDYVYVNSNEIEIAKIKNTKLARKLYPNYREVGAYLEI